MARVIPRDSLETLNPFKLTLKGTIVIEGVTPDDFCRTEDSQRLTKFILAETTTLGVRMRRESRAALTRRHVSVSTKWGDIRMKLANLNGSISNYAPEYEDCRQIAKEKKVPLKTVMQEAIKVYLENTNG